MISHHVGCPRGWVCVCVCACNAGVTRGDAVKKMKKERQDKETLSNSFELCQALAKLTCSCANRSLCSKIVFRSDKTCTSSASALKASATVCVRWKHAIPGWLKSCESLATEYEESRGESREERGGRRRREGRENKGKGKKRGLRSEPEFLLAEAGRALAGSGLRCRKKNA